MLFTFAVAIFGLISGSVAKLDDLIGCNTNYTGILSAWNHIDKYLITADDNFCSSACPCSITNITGFTNNMSILTNYTLWDKTGTATAFQNCSSTVKETATAAYNEAANDTTSFNDTSFMKYFGTIEEKFNCSGFCTTSYQTNGGLTTKTMYKYLFTDINR
jgi:hypothetical protein